MNSPNPDRATPEIFNLRSAEIFQQLYAQSYLAVFRFIYGLHGGPAEEVEDLAAETFARAWKSRRRFQGSQRAALGWLFKIARNLVIDQHRRQQNRSIHEDIERVLLPASEPNPEDQTQVREQVQILWSLLPTLPHQQREILVLRYMLGWRVQEIGEFLEMNENTVSVYIRRALKRLRQDWPGTNYDDE
jgi:RNA polymerase sigma-70 factor (ECF subfamily)